MKLLRTALGLEMGPFSALCAVCSLVISSGPALARNYGMGGCGLGSLVVSNKTWNAQTTAHTTNGTGTQTFGITSGTSNCTPDEQKSAARIRAEIFVSTNLNDLEKDIARGQGPTLQALGNLFGCSETARASLGEVLQDNHSVIFASPGGGAVLETITRVIDADQDLPHQCLKIPA